MPHTITTYIINFDHFAAIPFWRICSRTPLPVASVNGIATAHAKKCREFPNPGANEMAKMYTNPLWREIAGQIACTIIEYTDKTTGAPILTLYPNGDILYTQHNIHSKNNPTPDMLMAQLDDKSRQDLAQQLTLRKATVEIFNKQNHR